MKDFTVEELKTIIGHLMLDLRGNWGFSYQERMELVEDALNLLLNLDPENQEYKEDLAVTKGEISEPEDGRIFRDVCNLYGYGSDEGKTPRVHEYLNETLSYPEYNNFDLEIAN